MHREYRQDQEQPEHAQRENRRQGGTGANFGARHAGAGRLADVEDISEYYGGRSVRDTMQFKTRYSIRLTRFNPSGAFVNILLAARFISLKAVHGRNPHPRRAHAQPQEHQSRSAAQQADRHHRPVRLRQILARLRHPVRRRPAALCRIAVGLRAPVPAIDGKAGRRPDRRPVAGDFDRAESHLAQPALDRRHRHRNPRLPAPAVRARRHALLPGPPGKSAGGADRSRRWSMPCWRCRKTPS